MSIKQLSKEDFVKACSESESMVEACASLGLHFNTFKTYATKYGCYEPNKGKLKGGRKLDGGIDIKEVIIEGKHPGYSRKLIKRKLINQGYKECKCEECGRKKWNGKAIPLELEHVDGNKQNNLIKNLKLLCPNCHAQTSTYRGKNK